MVFMKIKQKNKLMDQRGPCMDHGDSIHDLWQHAWIIHNPILCTWSSWIKQLSLGGSLFSIGTI